MKRTIGHPATVILLNIHKKPTALQRWPDLHNNIMLDTGVRIHMTVHGAVFNQAV